MDIIESMDANAANEDKKDPSKENKVVQFKNPGLQQPLNDKENALNSFVAFGIQDPAKIIY